MLEIVVGREQREPVVDAKFSQQGVDCSDLYAGTPTTVSQLGRGYVIAPVRDQ